MMDSWLTIFYIIGGIISIFYWIRRENGRFDGGDLNKRDRDYFEDSEENGELIAQVKQAYQDGQRFWKK